MAKVGTLWIAKRPVLAAVGGLTGWEHVYLGFDDDLTWCCAGETGDAARWRSVEGTPACAVCTALPDQGTPQGLHSSGNANAGIVYASIPGIVLGEGGGFCHQIANRILYAYGPAYGEFTVTGAGGWQLTYKLTGWLGLDPWPSCSRCDCPRPKPAHRRSAPGLSEDRTLFGFKITNNKNDPTARLSTLDTRSHFLRESPAEFARSRRGMSGKLKKAAEEFGKDSEETYRAEYEAILDSIDLNGAEQSGLRAQLMEAHLAFREAQLAVQQRAGLGEIDEQMKTQQLAKLRQDALAMENELLGEERFCQLYGMPLGQLLELSRSAS